MQNKENFHHHHHHEHHHPHSHDHSHPQPKSLWTWFATLFHWHGHNHHPAEMATDRAFLDNTEGVRTVWLALTALAITSLIQIVIVLWSGSVALLADTLHNIGDGLNSIPLLIAFYLARRVATRRYTYGFARAEDVAGIFIVLSIAFSAGLIFWESFQKFLHPQPMTHLGWVSAAAVIGFLGNEAVAVLQIRVGRKIGSAAMVADGLHARTDGLSSLAVLVASGGTWLGWPIVDPLIGILIGITILFITKNTVVTMWYRLMDAIEPEILAQAETVVQRQAEIKASTRLRMRWLGHHLHAEVFIAVDPQLTTVASHEIAERLRHDLFHELPHLGEVVIHIDPWSEKPETFHRLTIQHEPLPTLANYIPARYKRSAQNHT